MRETPDKHRAAALRSEYTARINRVIDYIAANLGDELTLDTLAGVANFSPFHFHRVFGAMTGETLGHYVQRLRLERAAALLAQNPRRSITDVALDCGFSSSAVFARSFREVFAMTAGEWRRKKCKTIGNDGKEGGKPAKDWLVSFHYRGPGSHCYWEITMQSERATVNVEVRSIEPRQVAYICHTGPYKQDAALFARLFETLCRWAGPRGLLQQPGVQFLSVYHDDPEVTAEAKLRTSCCLSVPPGTQGSGEIGVMTIAGGDYAVGQFELGPNDYEAAWNALYAGWLPESGYQADDRPPFELYLNTADQHPEGKHIVEIHIPVKPL
jgi:AraC family transcriptional regulator